MGALLEIAQGVTGRGHCRLRDLVPDMVGASLAFLLIALWHSYRGRRSQEQR
jgi:VanZ family protein